MKDKDVEDPAANSSEKTAEQEAVISSEPGDPERGPAPGSETMESEVNDADFTSEIHSRDQGLDKGVRMASWDTAPYETQEDLAVESDAGQIEIDKGKTIPLEPLSDDTLATLEQGDTLGRQRKAPTIRVAQRCHVGLIRVRNEDSSYVFNTETGGQETLLPFGLYIVADGMGGHYAGHEASKNVSRIVAQYVLEKIYMPLLKNSSIQAGPPPEPVREVMLEAVQAANKAIHSPDPEKDSGTTLTAAVIFGRRLYVAHVGDSRAYLYTDGKLKLITTDHSYVRRLQEAGQITEEEAASHPQRNMLYMAVGQGSELDIDTFTQSLPTEGKLILCSDGMWGLVPEPMIQDVLERNISLKEMTDKLVEMALQAGGHDNITAILVDFSL